MAEVGTAMERYGTASVLDRAEWGDELTALSLPFETAGLDFQVVEPSADPAPELEAVTMARVLFAAALVAVAMGVGVLVLGWTLGITVGAVTGAATVLGYRALVQPWHLSWGATEAEVDAALHGDDLLEDGTPTNRAITIVAPVEQVWAWLVERGIGPGGWSVRGLIDDDRLGGSRIAPLIRNLGAGGTSATPGHGFEVHRIESPHTIVSLGPDGTSWCLHLSDAGAGRTRLVSRFRSRLHLVPGRFVLADPLAFLSERRMLRTLKATAERGAPLPRAGCPVAP